MTTTISNYTVCPLAACPMSAICARYKNYLEAKPHEVCYSVLNTELFTPTQDGCPHFVVKRQVQFAYGFKKLYSTVPVAHARNFWTGSPFGSESTYHRYRRGEYPMNPDLQQQLLEYFRANGADTSVGFDKYTDGFVYVKP